MQNPEPTLLIYLLAVLGGIVAGVINTIAGSGSLVTLPILAMLGLPANVANATNRLGIVIQSVTGTASMHRQGLLVRTGSLRYILPSCLGAVGGAWVASSLSAQAMNWFIGGVMVLMLGVTLFDPKAWLKTHSAKDATRAPWWMMGVFFGLGVYAGFLQAGVGVMMLVALVVGSGFTVVAANGIKMLIALCFSVVALGIFAWEGLIVWHLGLLVGAGQALGAWGAVRFLMHREDVGVWVRRLLIGGIVFGIVKFLVWPLALLLWP